jgi:hypothetical protein
VVTQAYQGHYVILAPFINISRVKTNVGYFHSYREFFGFNS